MGRSVPPHSWQQHSQGSLSPTLTIPSLQWPFYTSGEDYGPSNAGLWRTARASTPQPHTYHRNMVDGGLWRLACVVSLYAAARTRLSHHHLPSTLRFSVTPFQHQLKHGRDRRRENGTSHPHACPLSLSASSMTTCCILPAITLLLPPACLTPSVDGVRHMHGVPHVPAAPQVSCWPASDMGPGGEGLGHHLAPFFGASGRGGPPTDLFSGAQEGLCYGWASLCLPLSCLLPLSACLLALHLTAPACLPPHTLTAKPQPAQLHATATSCHGQQPHGRDRRGRTDQ